MIQVECLDFCYVVHSIAAIALLRPIQHLRVHIMKYALHEYFRVAPVLFGHGAGLCVDVFGQGLQLHAQVQRGGLDEIFMHRRMTRSRVVRN
jgi:dihydropteroate synthase